MTAVVMWTMDDEAIRRGHVVVGELLRQARLDAGLRQQDLASRLRVPQSFVSKIESGERRIDVVELQRVCIALSVPLAEFVRRLESSLGSGC